jgi:hypothetical protein
MIAIAKYRRMTGGQQVIRSALLADNATVIGGGALTAVRLSRVDPMFPIKLP